MLHPGHWNLQGGPDFRDAQVRLDGRDLRGDIEVHFRVSDWRAHSHRENPAFAAVILHVVLFPPAPDEAPAFRRDGTELPALVLLPLLLRDLEEHVSDDALETLTARDEWRMLAELANRPPAELPPLLRRHALRRWRQKVGFARLRIDRLGWTGAVHHAALEILGYRHNRAPMLAVATRVPLAQWADQATDPDAVFAADGLNWHRQGLRPANQPRARLRQYAAWVRARPDWPERLVAWAESIPSTDPVVGHLGEVAPSADPTAHVVDQPGGPVPASEGPSHRPGLQPGPSRAARRQLELARRRDQLATDVLGNALSGTRLDNLACDGFLPLLAARTGRDLFAAWFHWFLGDAPDQVKRALPRLGLTGTADQPVCQGFAQGLLGWLLERETRASGWRSDA